MMVLYVLTRVNSSWTFIGTTHTHTHTHTHTQTVDQSTLSSALRHEIALSKSSYLNI